MLVDTKGDYLTFEMLSDNSVQFVSGPADCTITVVM